MMRVGAYALADRLVALCAGAIALRLWFQLIVRPFGIGS
jgi:hypothetical protein